MALRIGVAESVVHTWLPAMLTRLRDRLPRMRFELSVDTSIELRRKLRGDELDFAVLMRQLVPEDAVSTPLGRIEICWLAASSVSLPEGPLSPAALAAHPIVTFPKNTPPYWEIERLFADPRLPVPLLHGCASLSTIAHLVRDGFGIGTLPRRMAQEGLASGRLRELAVSDDAVLNDLEFWATHMPGRNESLSETVLQAMREASGSG